MASIAVPERMEIGVVGLYPAGRKLVRAMAEHGVKVVAYDCNPDNVHALQDETAGTPLRIAKGLPQFMRSFGHARTIVVSGADAGGDLFARLVEKLDATDLVIDAGASYFKECTRRANSLAERNISYLELGILEGGAAVLAGGRPETFFGALPVLESMAVNGEASRHITHVGPAPSAHFVKMIYDGIEFGLMQLGLESFGLLVRALKVGDGELRRGAGAQLASFNGQGHDEAARWTCHAARELGVATPTIDATVGLRALSDLEKANTLASSAYRQPLGHFGDDKESVLAELRSALHAAIIITYAQAVSVLSTASAQYGFGLDLPAIIRTWRDCCNQRGGLLDQIAAALEATPHLANLLDDDDLSEAVMEHQERLRHVLWRAEKVGASAPALLASLDYLDSYRGAWLPVNMIQPFTNPAARAV
jgi:6-phosphogluconate dehydrogenase